MIKQVGKLHRTVLLDVRFKTYFNEYFFMGVCEGMCIQRMSYLLLTTSFLVHMME